MGHGALSGQHMGQGSIGSRGLGWGALVSLWRTTLRQLLMRPPHSVRAWMHGVAAWMHGVAARDLYRLQAPRSKPRYSEL